MDGYYYYTRFEEGNEYPVYCRKKGSLKAKEEIMLNVNEMAKGHSYYDVSTIDVSKSNNIIAYGVDTFSRRLYTICFKDLATGKVLKDKILNTSGSVAWANDNKTVFYTIKDKDLRPFKVFKHVIGTDVSKDAEVYHEQDNTFDVFVYKTKSKEYIIIGSGSTLSNECRFISADKPDSKFKIIQPREKEHEYSVLQYKDKFYILTNYKAKNFRLMETSISSPGKENWKEVIPCRDDVLLEDMEIFRDFMVIGQRNKGLTQLSVIKWADMSEYLINFDEETYTTGISVNMEFNTDTLRFDYASLTMPRSVYDFNMNTKEKVLMKRQEVVGDFNPDNYKSERVYVTAGDGAKIPVSLVYRKGIRKDGSNPLLLYGYGSYGICIDPGFNYARLSLLDRGFIFAIAHIRGGVDMGRQWYDDGKMLNKKNTFTDFIACAEYFINEKYTDKDKLFAMGGSAGGLLIGAVINMKPEFFKAVVAQVPFVDVVTTMLDETIPLTTGEYDQWGNPNEKKYYDYILSYSPYDNVEKKNYPAMLVTTGLHDSQVQYWEPAKWVAKLRDMKTDDNIILLHTNMDVGHGGASGRFEPYRETALEFAFMLDQLKIYK